MVVRRTAWRLAVALALQVLCVAVVGNESKPRFRMPTPPARPVEMAQVESPVLDEVRGGRGYAAYFQRGLSMMGTKAGPFNFSEPALEGLERQMTIAWWGKYFPTSSFVAPGVVWRVASSENNYILDYQFGVGIVNFHDWIQEDSIGFFSWNHYAVVVEDSTNYTIVTLYVNGGEMNQKKVEAFSVAQGDATFYLGGLLYTGGEVKNRVRANELANFRGAVDDLMIFSHALDQAYVQNIMVHGSDHSVPYDPALYFDMELEIGSCVFSSTAASCDQVIPNKGTAGSKYDLLIGGINDDFGHGSSYVGTTDLLFLKPKAFIKPNFGSSTIGNRLVKPVEGGTFQVLFVQPSTTANEKISFPINVTLKNMPSIGSLCLQDGASCSELHGETLIVAHQQLVFKAPTFFREPIRLEFEPTAGAARPYEVHVWPSQPPELVETQVTLDVMQGSYVNIAFSEYLLSPHGEFFDVVLDQLPPECTTERALQLELPWSGITPQFDMLKTGDRITVKEGLQVRVTPWSNTSQNKFSMQVHFISPLTNLTSAPLTLTVAILKQDTVPYSSDSQAQIEEDSQTGVDIPLQGGDLEETHGIAFHISSLPKFGDLFASYDHCIRPWPFSDDSDIRCEKVKMKIKDTYQSYGGALGEVVSQYAEHVSAVSSFALESILEPKARAVEGPPSCKRIGNGVDDMCTFSQSQFTDEAAAKQNPGHIVRVYLDEDLVQYSLEEYQQATSRANMRLQAHLGKAYPTFRNGAMTFDVALLPTFRFSNETESPSIVRCFPRYHVDDESGQRACDPESKHLKALPMEKIDSQGQIRDPVWLFDVDIMNLQPPKGFWQPYFQKFVAGNSINATGRDALFLGPELRFSHQQDQFYQANSDVPYTEWIELRFATPVVPSAVNIGFPRGGGAVVGIKALNMRTKQWISLFSGTRQTEQYLATSALGNYFLFEESICKVPFLTDTLRIELDTSEETGIGDWQFLDFVQLTGASGAPTATAVTDALNANITYVPHADAYGEDSFTFQVSDCLGKLSRSTEPAHVRIQVKPSVDKPRIQLEPSPEVGEDGQHVLHIEPGETVPLFVSCVQVDGQAVDLVLGPDALSGEGLLQDARYTEQKGNKSLSHIITERWLLPFTSAPCGAFSAPSAILELRCRDSTGAEQELIVRIDALCKNIALTTAMFVCVVVLVLCFIGILMRHRRAEKSRKERRKIVGFDAFNTSTSFSAVELNASGVRKEHEKSRRRKATFYALFISAAFEIYDLLSDIISFSVIASSPVENKAVIVLYACSVGAMLAVAADVLRLRSKFMAHLMHDDNSAGKIFGKEKLNEMEHKDATSLQTDEIENLAVLFTQNGIKINLLKRLLLLALVEDLPSVMINFYFLSRETSPLTMQQRCFLIMSLVASSAQIGHKITHVFTAWNLRSEQIQILAILNTVTSSKMSQHGRRETFRDAIDVNLDRYDSVAKRYSLANGISHSFSEKIRRRSSATVAPNTAAAASSATENIINQ